MMLYLQHHNIMPIHRTPNDRKLRVAFAKQPAPTLKRSKVPPSRQGLVQSGVYLLPAVHGALAKLAIDLKCSRQSLMAEAVDALLKKRGVTVETLPPG